VKEIRGKKALVTGAASGIGRAMALRLAREGAELALVDIDAEGLDRTASELHTCGGNAMQYVIDLQDPAQITELYRRVTDEFGTPDILMNAAGIAVVGPAEAFPMEVWEQVLGLNLLAYVGVIHEFLPDMVRRSSGHIVNVASAAGLFAVPFQAPYVTSKFGVVGLSEALRWELFRNGIGVTAVCPGAIETPIIDKALCMDFNEEMVKGAGHTLAVSVDGLADAIVRGIRKNSAVVMFPFYIRLIHGLKKFSPRLADIVGKVLARLFCIRNS